MIPRVIELKNFLSYGDIVQTIDFKNHDLICLSGRNGNGKSALLDAFTWALWGQARKITGALKADEGLLRLGQTRMMVCAEFELGQQVYRVRREFAKTYGKPYVALDFEIFDHTRNAYSSLTDKTIRTTQEKIEQLLGLDYETFINTSFLRQGQANEFSKKTPKERKQILATILGFSKYDFLQQQALDATHSLMDEKKLLVQLIDQSKQEIEQEPLLTEQLQQTHATAEKINQSIEAINQVMLEKEQTIALFTDLKNQLFRLQKEQTSIKQKQLQKYNLFKDMLTTWKNTHKTTLLLPNLQEFEAQKRALLDQEKHFLELRQKSIAIQERQLMLKQQLHQRQSYLTTELEKNSYTKRIELEKQSLLLQQQTEQLEQKQKLLKELAQKHTTLTADLISIQKNKTTVEASALTFQTHKKQFEKRRAFYQTLIHKGNWLKTALQEADHKKRIVEDLSNPACPLCEQMLTAKRKHFLAAKLISHEQRLQHQIVRINTIIKRLKTLLVKQHETIEKQERDLEALRQYTEQEHTFILTLAQLTPTYDQLVVEITNIQKHIEQNTQSHKQHRLSLHQMEKDGLAIINQDAEIKKFTQQLNIVEQEKNAHTHNQDAYNTLQDKIKQLDQSISNIIHLNSQREQQTIRRTHIHHLINELKELKKTNTNIEEQLRTIQTKLTQEEPLRQTLEHIKQEFTTVVKQKEQTLHQQARLENELQRIGRIKATSTTQKTQIVNLDQEIDDYQTLAQAFSKNGIQALLIEEAIPEIEQEANALLAKLTDNQAQIFIESLRDLKSGGVKETLDIHISDAAGIRPYEMYSGGEAFRIDFALRVAISKLLAQRAGTALQTLIIDEGFGSQDEEGLARITEALYNIKNDFSKIIVVSHLPEMKDSFPVHFMIEKQAGGSIVRVEERG